jgi:hypothetical protein
MLYFQTKNLGKTLEGLAIELVWFIVWPIGLCIVHTAFWYILWSLGIFLVYFLVYFFRFGMLSQEKSGNPGWKCLYVRAVNNKCSII